MSQRAYGITQSEIESGAELSNARGTSDYLTRARDEIVECSVTFDNLTQNEAELSNIRGTFDNSAPQVCKRPGSASNTDPGLSGWTIKDGTLNELRVHSRHRS